MKCIDGWIDEALDGHYGAKANSRQGHAPKYLVLHGTAGGSSALAIDNFFTNGLDSNGQPVQASAHVIIDQQGVVIQGISLDMAAWANCCLAGNHASWLNTAINQNLYTCSIEHVKAHDDNSDVLTSVQAQKSFQVIQCICDAYGIPKRAGDANGGIVSHADLDTVNRARCPGLYPWDALWTYLKGGTTGTIPQGWKDDGKVLTAPNGIGIDSGFRAYVLSHQWDAANIPLGPAYGAGPAQLHRADLGMGTRQLFKFGLLWWTPKGGVICEQQWGLELDAAYRAIPKKA